MRFTRLAQPHGRKPPQQKPALPPTPPRRELLVRNPGTTLQFRLGSLVETTTLADLRAVVAKLRVLPARVPGPGPGSKPKLSRELDPVPVPEPEPEPKPQPEPEPEPEPDTVAADVETARWIKENTRPCPSCGTVIEKAGGCVRRKL